MRKTIWLSFDFGVRGDYEGIFEFLASAGAKECGTNLGVFSFDFQTDLLKELTAMIKKHTKLDRRSRIYVMYIKPNGKPTGQFIFGKRKGPPWAGFGLVQGDEEDVSE